MNALTDLKVEPAIARDYQKVQAIRVYPSKVLKKEFSKSRKVDEVSLVFKGTHHIEDLNYYEKDPATWTTWGEIYLTPAQALQLAEKIKHIAKAPAGEPAQTVLVKLANMTISRQEFERLRTMLVSGPRSRSRAPPRRQNVGRSSGKTQRQYHRRSQRRSRE